MPGNVAHPVAGCTNEFLDGTPTNVIMVSADIKQRKRLEDT